MKKHFCSKCGKEVIDYIDEMEIRDDNGQVENIQTDPTNMTNMGYDKCIDCRGKFFDDLTEKVANLFGVNLNEDWPKNIDDIDKPKYVIKAEKLLSGLGHKWCNREDLINIAQVDVNNNKVYLACWDIINYIDTLI